MGSSAASAGAGRASRIPCRICDRARRRRAQQAARTALTNWWRHTRSQLMTFPGAGLSQSVMCNICEWGRACQHRMHRQQQAACEQTCPPQLEPEACAGDRRERTHADHTCPCAHTAHVQTTFSRATVLSMGPRCGHPCFTTQVRRTQSPRSTRACMHAAATHVRPATRMIACTCQACTCRRQPAACCLLPAWLAWLSAHIFQFSRSLLSLLRPGSAVPKHGRDRA